MAIYDIPAQINFIRKFINNKEKIYYVGYSMGSTTALIYSSLLPQHAKNNIKHFTLMAPAAYFKNIKTPVKHFAVFGDLIMVRK